MIPAETPEDAQEAVEALAAALGVEMHEGRSAGSSVNKAALRRHLGLHLARLEAFKVGEPDALPLVVRTSEPTAAAQTPRREAKPPLIAAMNADA